MEQGMYLEIDTEETAEEYSKRVYMDFQNNMDLVLGIVPDIGVSFRQLVESSPDEIYKILAENEEISNIMANYAANLKRSDMLLLAFMTDIAANDGNAQGAITNMIKLSDDDALVYNFFLVCIMYMKYVFMPLVLKESLKRQQLEDEKE